MRRFPWDLLLALLVGAGVGLAYAWILAPRQVTNADPVALRADFKDDYRMAIAAAYAASGNLPRAQARLALLRDANSVEALNAQAQRMLAAGDPLEQADQVAALAQALEGEATAAPTSVPATEIAKAIEVTSTATFPPPPEAPIVLTETQLPADTQAPADAALTLAVTPTPRATRTVVPTQGAPFKLTGQENTCDPNLPEGLLQVIVVNAKRRQLPGIQINITWDGGEEQFFTGLKPELGNGYADYVMTPAITYTVQLAVGSDIATGLTTSTCQSPSGENFAGGIKLTFQQP